MTEGHWAESRQTSAATDQHRKVPKWVWTTDIQERSQNLLHFYSGMSIKFKSSGFSPNQNSCGLSGAYVTCIYCGLNVKVNICENRRRVHDDDGRICFVFVVVCVVGKNPKTPNLSPMADGAITQAVYEVWDLPCLSVV